MEPEPGSRRFPRALEHVSQRWQHRREFAPDRSPAQPRATTVDGFSEPQGSSGGDFLTGVAGDGPTLVYAKAVEVCDNIQGIDCHRLDAVGGVTFVNGQLSAPTIPTIPAPVMLAFAAHDPQSSKRESRSRWSVWFRPRHLS